LPVDVEEWESFLLQFAQRNDVVIHPGDDAIDHQRLSGWLSQQHNKKAVKAMTSRTRQGALVD